MISITCTKRLFPTIASLAHFCAQPMHHLENLIKMIAIIDSGMGSLTNFKTLTTMDLIDYTI